MRLGAGGGVDVRASSHGHYQWCKQEECNNRWGPRTGWTRVSSGSHAGHVPLERETEPRRPPGDPRRAHRYSYEPQLPGHDLHERTTTGEGLRLVPLETIDRRSYRPLDDDIDPPWSKPVYDDPESGES